MLSLFACKKNQTLESIQAQTDFSSIDYKDLVFKMGFDTVDIVKNGDTIIVEGDILLYEHKLKADPKTFPRQATVHKNMRMDDQYLTFYISQFNSPHQQSIIEGLQTFLESNLPNGINGAKLMFSNPASPDITIIFYEESSAVCGFAEFPTVLTSTIPMAPIDFEPGKKCI